MKTHTDVDFDPIEAEVQKVIKIRGIKHTIEWLADFLDELIELHVRSAKGKI